MIIQQLLTDFNGDVRLVFNICTHCRKYSYNMDFSGCAGNSV